MKKLCVIILSFIGLLLTSDKIESNNQSNDELYRRMGYNMVTEHDRIGVAYSYLEKGKEKIKLGGGFGSIGVNSSYIADINNDYNPEFIYIYSWGSGMNYTNLGAFTHNKLIKSRFFSSYNCMFFLKKVNDQDIEVYTYKPWNPKQHKSKNAVLNVGKVVFVKNKKGDLVLDVRLRKTLPNQIKQSMIKIKE